MTRMSSLSQTLQTLFTTVADELAQTTGLVRRRRKLTGALLAQTLVFGLLAKPLATLRELQQAAATAGTAVSVQALAQRCTATAATFLCAVLARALETVVTSEPAAIPLLQRFAAVVVMDSTTVALPAALADVWRGCGGSTPTAAQAALKIHWRSDLCRGGVDGLTLHAGRSSDQRAPSQTLPIPANALRLSDRGFFAIPVLRTIVAAGGHFLTHPPPRLSVRTPGGSFCSLTRFLEAQPRGVVDLTVEVGVKDTLRCRLLAVPVPIDVAERRRGKERAEARGEGRAVRTTVLAQARWTLLLTSLSPADLSVQEALVLARLRWQVELVFKLWKSAGNALPRWRCRDKWRVLCTVYAKLLACLVQHWLLVCTCWELPDKSLVAAATTLRSSAFTLLRSLRRSRRCLRNELADLRRVITSGCRLQKRKTHPAAFQLLLDPSLQPLS